MFFNLEVTFFTSVSPPGSWYSGRSICHTPPGSSRASGRWKRGRLRAAQTLPWWSSACHSEDAKTFCLRPAVRHLLPCLQHPVHPHRLVPGHLQIARHVLAVHQPLEDGQIAPQTESDVLGSRREQHRGAHLHHAHCVDQASVNPSRRGDSAGQKQ